MRRKKIEGILCLTGMLLLTGCGTKAYDLTEAEESQIVNYAVHVVSKHNSYQKDGLVYVDQSAEETESSAKCISTTSSQIRTASGIK